MKSSYSFLADELALMEIRKHKWIESQKAKEEIGFATAALNWINKHGHDWRLYRLATGTSQNVFEEKRRYRRFAYNVPLTIRTQDQSINACTDDITFVGLSCTLPMVPQEKSNLAVTLSIDTKEVSEKKAPLRFNSRIIRVAPRKHSQKAPLYHVVLSFAEDVRDYLRLNTNLFCSALG